MPNVLIIDREPQMQKALCQLFISRGYRAAAVSHGAEAARLMRREAPDLILIDQDAPLSGIRTAQILRLHPLYGHIPLLLGLKIGPRPQMEEVLQQGQKIGLAGVLARPYEPTRLLQKVKECLPENGGPAGGEGDGRSSAPTLMEVRKQIRELTDLPTLSPAQHRVIAIMSRDDAEVDVDELVGTIQSDQALTMRIIRIARSAYYGFTGNFIRTAITFMGMPRVRQIVQSATVLEVFNAKGKPEKGGLDRKGAWEHSVACGLVMQKISHDNRHARHFTVGLLHDVGKLVIDCQFHEYSRTILDIAAQEKRPMHLVEKEIIGLSHAEIGHELANLWQLPNEIAESILHHHEPALAYRHKYLSSLVYLSDVVVRQMGIGDSGNHAPPTVDDPYAQKLRVPLQEVTVQRDDLAKQVEAIVSAEEK